ncbi:brefeldin A-inhibited guanine nucleotide-exchange protein 5 isoform X3 [Physcomitrium patens]|uniref:brefeldin A-inhibited guanine nucleotide-exchange protein 5 isoform X3 n=1 Tax=Physcomitrium patens TaxID=3218 RepID=UPI003CCD7414
MADAGGAFVTRSFERMLKESSGKKYANLQNALKAYLDSRHITSPVPPPGQLEEPNLSRNISGIQDFTNNEDTSSLNEIGATFQTVNTQEPLRQNTGLAAAATMTEAGKTLEGSEAEVVLLPLRLAFETKQSKIIEPALDCLHKLISYGHLEGEAGLTGGKNEAMLTELFNMVCRLSDDGATGTNQNVVLQVIKVLLTAVASPSYHVHRECLLTAVRTCYNIVLSSKSPVNQATAKATLMQMMNTVFIRMENNTERVKSRKLDQGESSKDSKQSQPTPSQMPVEDLKHLSGVADIQGFEAALNKVVEAEGELNSEGAVTSLESLTVGQQDGVLMLRTICKLAVKEETDDLSNRTKILSLDLLQGLLEGVSDAFTVNYTFIDFVKAYLCYALLRSCVSPTASVFQMAVNIYTVLLQRFRESLKAEVGVFFSLVVLRSFDNPETPPPHCTSVLKMLEKTCNDPQLLVDIFVNYDCDLESTNLFQQLINSLSRMAQEPPPVEPNANPIVVTQYRFVTGLCIQCLTNVLQSLEAWTKKDGLGPVEMDDPELIQYRTPKRGSKFEMNNVMKIDSEPTDEAKITTQADDFEKAKARKVSMETAVIEFNRKPAEGIKFLLTENLLPNDPKFIARFLHDTPGLNKKQIGDYLGQHGEFQLAVMHAYVDGMNFVGMKFDKALRMFLNGFRLPGEAQKIDRIMEKFAERYCRDNGNLFKNADTAYVLAYAVIMLNTDAHNPQVVTKMTKADFVNINSSTGAEEHAPKELLEEIYDSIVNDEIKLKDENAIGPKHEEKSVLLDVLDVLKLGGASRKAADMKQESENIIKRTQAAFRKTGQKQGVFHKPDHSELARPMLDVCGLALLAAFEVTMERTSDEAWILLCLKAFYTGAGLTTSLGLQNLRNTFVAGLIRFTSLHSAVEMQNKNVEALRALFDLCQNRIDALQSSWKSVLECVSRLEFITTSPFFAVTVGPNQIFREDLLLSLLDLMEKPTEQVFANTVKLPGDVAVEFFSGLCEVSAKELNEVPPRVFSLTKMVEISYYNITRIRMVWGKIWAVLSLHFVAAGSHDDEKIAMYAIDSLRQLAHKYLARSELAKFTFQNDILKPFVVLVRSSKNPTIRALIVDCMIQMTKSKVTSIKSGWKSVFMVFTSAAFDYPEISANAFENVEQVVLEHFEQVMADSFMDCVNCLIAFANNKSQSSARTSLKAIALLRICEERLAEGHIPGGVSRVVAEERGRDQEVAENYWFPMLSGLSELISDPRTEVRNCALEVLFDLLKERGHNFSGPFWKSVFHRILFPIFEDVRREFSYEGKLESKNIWFRETCIVSLRLICDLFSSYYKEVSFLMPELLRLLLDCATQPDQTLASMSMRALTRFTEEGGDQFKVEDWTTLLEHIRDACYATQPKELLDPETMFTFDTSQSSVWTHSGTVTTPGSDQLLMDGYTLKNGEEAAVGAGESAQITGKGGFIGGVMKSILHYRRKSVPPESQSGTTSEEFDDGDDIHSSDEESLALQKVRSKCVIQLLLLSTIESLQKHHWQRFEPSQKLLIMDTLFSLVEFAASYNSDIKLRQRMRKIAGDWPPPSLLRQEAEGTQLYLAMLTLSAMGHEADATTKESKRNWINMGRKSPPPESEKLRQEAERRLMAFYGHVLREIITLQSRPGDTTPTDVYKSLSVLKALSTMENRVFEKHLPQFYPYLTRLICCDQLDVRKALGELFLMRLMTLLPEY